MLRIDFRHGILLSILFSIPLYNHIYYGPNDLENPTQNSNSLQFLEECQWFVNSL